MSRISRIVRSLTLVAALTVAAPAAFAFAEDPSNCTNGATGSTTGQRYTLQGQSEYKVTLEVAPAGVGGSVEETFNVGYYTNDTTGARVKVNCSTKMIIGSW